MASPTVIDFNLEKRHYHQLNVSINRYNGSYKFFNDLSSRLCVPNKTKDLNLNVFNMIAKINESKIITNHISRKCKTDGRKCKSNKTGTNICV